MGNNLLILVLSPIAPGIFTTSWKFSYSYSIKVQNSSATAIPFFLVIRIYYTVLVSSLQRDGKTLSHFTIEINAD